MNQSRIVANITSGVTLILVCGLCFALYPGFDLVREHLTLYITAYAVLLICGWLMSASVRSILQPPPTSQKPHAH